MRGNRIGDRRSLTDWPLRDHRTHDATGAPLDVEMRNVPKCVLIEDRDADGNWIAQGHQGSDHPIRTLGDLQGAFHLAAVRNKRRCGSWFFAAPAVTTAADLPAGATSARSVQVRPVGSQRFVGDDRYEEATAFVHPGSPSLRPDTPGVLLAGTHERHQDLFFLPSEPGVLVAVHRAGDPAFGSLVHDLLDDDSLDERRVARLQTGVRVALMRPRAGCAPGLLGAEVGQLAQQWGFTRGRVSAGGLVSDESSARPARVPDPEETGLPPDVYDAGGGILLGPNPSGPGLVQYSPSGEPLGGVVYQDGTRFEGPPAGSSGGGAIATTERTPRTGSVVDDPTLTPRSQTDDGREILATTSWRCGGYGDVGAADDVHRIGTSRDGEPINMLHFSTRAIHKDPFGSHFDHGVFYDESPWQREREGRFWTTTRQRVNPDSRHLTVCGTFPGRIEWQTKVSTYTLRPGDGITTPRPDGSGSGDGRPQDGGGFGGGLTGGGGGAAAGSGAAAGGGGGGARADATPLGLRSPPGPEPRGNTGFGQADLDSSPIDRREGETEREAFLRRRAEAQERYRREREERANRKREGDRLNSARRVTKDNFKESIEDAVDRADAERRDDDPRSARGSRSREEFLRRRAERQERYRKEREARKQKRTFRSLEKDEQQAITASVDAIAAPSFVYRAVKRCEGDPDLRVMDEVPSEIVSDIDDTSPIIAQSLALGAATCNGHNYGERPGGLTRWRGGDADGLVVNAPADVEAGDPFAVSDRFLTVAMHPESMIAFPSSVAETPLTGEGILAYGGWWARRNRASGNLVVTPVTTAGAYDTTKQLSLEGALHIDSPSGSADNQWSFNPFSGFGKLPMQPLTGAPGSAEPGAPFGAKVWFEEFQSGGVGVGPIYQLVYTTDALGPYGVKLTADPESPDYTGTIKADGLTGNIDVNLAFNVGVSEGASPNDITFQGDDAPGASGRDGGSFIVDLGAGDGAGADGKFTVKDGAGVTVFEVDGETQKTTIVGELDPTSVEWSDGAAVAVSSASKAKVRYVASTDKLEVSKNGAAFEEIWSGSSPGALDPDLAAIAALTGSGYLRRLSDGTWALTRQPGAIDVEARKRLTQIEASINLLERLGPQLERLASLLR